MRSGAAHGTGWRSGTLLRRGAGLWTQTMRDGVRGSAREEAPHAQAKTCGQRSVLPKRQVRWGSWTDRPPRRGCGVHFDAPRRATCLGSLIRRAPWKGAWCWASPDVHALRCTASALVPVVDTKSRWPLLFTVVLHSHLADRGASAPAKLAMIVNDEAGHQKKKFGWSRRLQASAFQSAEPIHVVWLPEQGCY